MDKTIAQVAHSQCTGCGACYNKCPVNAIEMKADSEGFLFPRVDSDKCINCGLCLKTCPVVEPAYDNRPEPACYAVMASDEIRKKSSSGGVFTLLAEWMLDQGGVVCGAAYTDDCYSVEHIIATNRDELQRLRGSKYVQSNTGLVYTRVKEYLDNGMPVLFTGTPCQVAAVNSFLGKPYGNLYTLDLVCHGVPSPAVYGKFLEDQEKKYCSKVTSVCFRDKTIEPWNHCIKIEFENGQSYEKKKNECAFLKAFLQLMSVRKSCGNCPFATLPRQGDLTIADFWNAARFDPKLDDRKGTSLVLANNGNGQVLLKVLQNTSILFHEAPLDYAVKNNAQIKYSSVLHPHRVRFFDLLNIYHYDFEKAVDYGLHRRFDIGYIGWWYGQNYGSAMTSYAINRVLNSMGKTVLMLDWPILAEKAPAHFADTKTRRFAKHFYEQSMITRMADYKRFNYHCDTFVVGSDQLWNWYSNRDIGTYYYFLDFVDDWRKKIAYSTSFGHDNVYYPEEMRLKISYLLNRFDAISVREKSAVEVCRRDFNVDAVQTMDPVFLCSMEDYDKAIALSNVEITQPYVLAYILNPTDEKMESIRYVASQLHLPYHVILDGQDDFEKLKALANDPNVLENIEIADWLKYFKNAEYVITDSFHGFCYSIIFSRNMAVFPNKLRGLARFDTLSQSAGLEDRLFYSKEALIKKAPWTKPVDFDQVRGRMQPQIDYSIRWLKDALDMPKQSPTSKELELKHLLEDREKLCRLESENRKLNERINTLNDNTSKPEAGQCTLKAKFKDLLRPTYYRIRQILRNLKWRIFRK